MKTIGILFISIFIGGSAFAQKKKSFAEQLKVHCANKYRGIVKGDILTAYCECVSANYVLEELEEKEKVRTINYYSKKIPIQDWEDQDHHLGIFDIEVCSHCMDRPDWRQPAKVKEDKPKGEA